MLFHVLMELGQFAFGAGGGGQSGHRRDNRIVILT